MWKCFLLSVLLLLLLLLTGTIRLAEGRSAIYKRPENGVTQRRLLAHEATILASASASSSTPEEGLQGDKNFKLEMAMRQLLKRHYDELLEFAETAATSEESSKIADTKERHQKERNDLYSNYENWRFGLQPNGHTTASAAEAGPFKRMESLPAYNAVWEKAEDDKVTRYDVLNLVIAKQMNRVFKGQYKELLDKLGHTRGLENLEAKHKKEKEEEEEKEKYKEVGGKRRGG